MVLVIAKEKAKKKILTTTMMNKTKEEEKKKKKEGKERKQQAKKSHRSEGAMPMRANSRSPRSSKPRPLSSSTSEKPLLALSFSYIVRRILRSSGRLFATCAMAVCAWGAAGVDTEWCGVAWCGARCGVV